MTDPNNQTNTDATAELPPVDDCANATEALREKLTDAQTPSFQVELDPDEAERVGAFVEDALSEQDAAASGDDLMEVDGALELAYKFREDAAELYGPRAADGRRRPAQHRVHGRPGPARPHQDTADIPTDQRTIQNGQHYGTEEAV